MNYFLNFFLNLLIQRTLGLDSMVKAPPPPFRFCAIAPKTYEASTKKQSLADFHNGRLTVVHLYNGG